LNDSLSAAGQPPQPLIPSIWLKLGEAKDRLIALRPYSAVEVEEQINAVVRDGVMPGRTGNGLRIRLDGNENPWLQRDGPWLRIDPQLDFVASTIMAPRRGAPETAPAYQDLTKRYPARFWSADEHVPVLIEINRKDFEQLLGSARADADPHDTEPATSTAGPKPAKNRGGRPRVYNWDEFWLEVVRLANTPDGLPDEGDLSKHMRDYMDANFDNPPSDRSIQEKLQLINDRLRR
jgi:hypothetical protein